MSAAAIQCLPSSAHDASRLALRLGVPMHEIDVHQFPDGELRVTVGPAASTTILYFSLDRPNDKLISISCLPPKRCGATVPSGSYSSRLTFATCARTLPSGQARPSARRSSAGCWRAFVDRVITVDAHLHRTASREVFPGIESDNLSAMPAIADTLRTTGFDSKTIVVGPDAESRPWVSDLAGRLGVALCGGAEGTPQ